MSRELLVRLITFTILIVILMAVLFSLELPLTTMGGLR